MTLRFMRLGRYPKIEATILMIEAVIVRTEANY